MIMISRLPQWSKYETDDYCSHIKMRLLIMLLQQWKYAFVIIPDMIMLIIRYSSHRKKDEVDCEVTDSTSYGSLRRINRS